MKPTDKVNTKLNVSLFVTETSNTQLTSMEKENNQSSQPWIERLRIFFISSRPWSFPASLTAVFLGTALAWKFQGQFEVFQLLLTSITVVSIHAAGNLVNTLYDFQNGFDTEKADDLTLVKRILKPSDVKSSIKVCYGIGITSFLAICFTAKVHFATVFLLFAVGVVGSFFYTGSIGLKYFALGDLVIFSTFGPLISLFVYAVQTGEVSVQVIVYALPLAFITEAILHGNNIRDLESDKRAGAVTIAIVLGEKYACALYSFLLLFPYVLLIVIAILTSVYLLLPLLTIPIACKLKNDCYHGNLAEIPQKTAQMNLLFGVLYVCGWLFVPW